MRLLLLAGTSDARRIAQGLAETDVTTIASLAGLTRQPIDLPCETRVGGFGGQDGFRLYLQTANIDAVVDATHPFAARMSQTAATICKALNIPHVQMLRPEWQPEPGDSWTEVASEAEVAALVPRGATVFLATGRQTLKCYGNMTGRRLICRQIDPPDHPFPFPGGEFLVGRPPFSVQDEVNLFQNLGVDWLVVKNSGGQASHSKLEAARLLGIPVAMIKRPTQPDCTRLSRVPEVLDWVARRVNS
jgi:precorrin-6A/cobalt-precorrin-6A reductase